VFKLDLMPRLPDNGFVLPAVHGGGDAGSGSWIGILDSALEKTTRILESGVSLELFPGVQALATNVHPLIVHYPIALLTAFFLLEVVGIALRREGLRQSASWMLYLGTLGAIIAVAAGLIAEGTVAHGEAVHEIMEWHGRLGIGVATLSLVLAVWRIVARTILSPMAKTLYLYLAAIMVICMFIGADLGGLMVYQYGVGVKSLQQPDDHHHHELASQQDVEQQPVPVP
jgi:uncharacterized membrane protein